MKNIDDYSTREDLPESLNRPNAKELAETWDRAHLKLINNQIYSVLIYPVIDSLGSDLVDALAIQLHCDFYDRSLSLEARRQIVKTSIAWHRIKGTPAAVEMLTQLIFKKSFTKEWFEYSGRPYFFRMVQDISDGKEDVTPETIDKLKKAIWMGKNVRSWLEMLEFHFNTEETVEYSEELSDLSLRLAFQDWMPYGHRIWVPERDGSLYRGGVAYRDGSFFRNGELFHSGMIPGEWPIHYGWDALSMDDLFLATYLSFFDDVSAGGLFRDGSITRNGLFMHGGTGTLPADIAFEFALHQILTDTITIPTGEMIGRLDLGFSDFVPYGHRHILQRDGEAYRGGIAYRDGAYIRDGVLLRNGLIPGEVWERFGKSDLDMDELLTFIAPHLFDDYTVGGLPRDGRIFRNGSFMHGGDALPVDFGFDFSMSQRIFDAVTMPGSTIGGRLDFNLADIVPYGHRYIVQHNGEAERGGIIYRDDSNSRDGGILRSGILPGDVWERGGKCDLSMDELFTAIAPHLFDDVSESDILRRGEVCRDGKFLHGKNILPADFGYGFAMGQKIEEAVPETDARKLSPDIAVSLSDLIPYGTNPIPEHNGKVERGGVGNRNGDIEHTGAYIRDGPTLNATAERGGKRDLEHDHLAANAYAVITDDASIEIISRNGKESRIGEIEHGENSLPRDKRLSAYACTVMEENVQPTDAGGNITVLYQLERCGFIHRDGEMERGGYCLSDDMSGDLSVIAMDRNGRFSRDGTMERAADGRRIAV